MKTLKLHLLTFFSLLFFNVFSQNTILPVNPDNGQIEYSEIVNSTALLKDTLFRKAELFFRNKIWQFGSSVFVLRDIVNGKIISIVRLDPNNLPGYSIDFSNVGEIVFDFEIYCHDSLFEYKLRNFMHESGFRNEFPEDLRDNKSHGELLGRHQRDWNIIRKTTDTKVREIIRELKKQLSI